MIEVNEIFSDSDVRVALWCGAAEDTNDLAVLADSIIENKISLISAPPGIVSVLWTYLEKHNVKILTRYYFEPINKNMDKDVSVLSENIVVEDLISLLKFVLFNYDDNETQLGKEYKEKYGYDFGEY